MIFSKCVVWFSFFLSFLYWMTLVELALDGLGPLPKVSVSVPPSYRLPGLIWQCCRFSCPEVRPINFCRFSITGAAERKKIIVYASKWHNCWMQHLLRWFHNSGDNGRGESVDAKQEWKWEGLLSSSNHHLNLHGNERGTIAFEAKLQCSSFCLATSPPYLSSASSASATADVRRKWRLRLETTRFATTTAASWSGIIQRLLGRA